jgi:hypothetical protein
MRTVKTRALLLSATTLFAVACTPQNMGESEIAPEIFPATAADPETGHILSTFDVNKYPVTKTVCDPFGDAPDPRSNQGLKAELWWINKGTPAQSSVGKVIEKGQRSDRTLFFSQLNVPTRIFDLGFASETGEAVKSDDGSTLIENFALRFKSILKLSPDQKPGLYEFAILSDDGAVMSFRDGDGTYRVNVNNDGNHSTRLGCSSTALQLNAESEIPMSLEYYQGPRHHISLIVLMREITSDSDAGKDQACGLAGNRTWFDPNNSSVELKPYKDLLARGWKPLSNRNYSLANEAMFNPCKDGVAPRIANLQVYERFNDGFIVTWNTDMPATSSVVVIDSKNQTSVVKSDNILRTSHSVRTIGQMPNTNYKVQAVSISATYGRAISAPLDAQTDY